MTKIGWVGVGLMGRPMVARLLAASHDVRVTTRRRESAESLLELGASWAADAAECAEDREVVFATLPDPSSVHEVFCGPRGALLTLAPGSILVDMSTSGVDAAVNLASSAAAVGVRSLDAPVSGGPKGAAEGTLAIMVGGDVEAYEDVSPILQALGSPTHFGPAGSGQRAKLINQVIIAGTMAGIAEAYALAARHGFASQQYLDTIRSGMAGSALLEFAWPRLVAGDLQPGFKVSHLIKDLRLALDESVDSGLNLPTSRLVLSLYEQVQAELGADVGTQALARAIAPSQQDNHDQHRPERNVP